jgi:hypothetical protein
MVKRLFCLLAIGLLLLTAWAPAAASGAVVLRGAEPVRVLAPGELAAYTDEAIVYITRTGEKYHEAGCPHLSRSSIPVTLEQALLEGRQPCGLCH